MTTKKFRKILNRLSLCIGIYVFINNKIVENNRWYNYFKDIC